MKKDKKNLPIIATEIVEEKGLTSTDPLTTYLNEVRKYPLLTREEELEIAKKYYDTKDAESAQTLVKSNLRFVIKVAADYSRFGAKMIDLIQEGNIGLMHAVKEFNPYKGNRLITYAVWWIKGYIQDYLMRQYSLVRIGTTQAQKKLFYQLQKQKEELEKLGQGENLALASKQLGLDEDEVRNMAQRMSGRDVSLDRPLDKDSTRTLADSQTNSEHLLPDEQLAQAEQLALLNEKIEVLRPQLNERELILLEERLLADEPLTLQEIGEKYKITREAVRQAEVRLMKKIKALME
jgi:RNA polymerase sigma-32 factor